MASILGQVLFRAGDLIAFLPDVLKRLLERADFAELSHPSGFVEAFDGVRLDLQ